MIEEVLISIVSAGVTGGLVVWLAKSVLTERIKGAIKSEYDLKLENYKVLLKSELETRIEDYKSEIKAKEIVSQSKWEIKREACLNALDIIDRLWSNMDWKGLNHLGKAIAIDDIETQTPPTIDDVRKCNNALALSCDTDSVLKEYKRCLKLLDNFSGASIVDLRNAIRGELGFGNNIDFDKDIAFIARVNKKAS